MIDGISVYLLLISLKSLILIYMLIFCGLICITFHQFQKDSKLMGYVSKPLTHFGLKKAHNWRWFCYRWIQQDSFWEVWNNSVFPLIFMLQMVLVHFGGLRGCLVADVKEWNVRTRRGPVLRPWKAWRSSRPRPTKETPAVTLLWCFWRGISTFITPPKHCLC